MGRWFLVRGCFGLDLYFRAQIKQNVTAFSRRKTNGLLILLGINPFIPSPDDV